MPVDLATVDEVATRVAAVYREGEVTMLNLLTHHLEQDLERPDWVSRRLAGLPGVRAGTQLVAELTGTQGARVAGRAAVQAYRSGVFDAVGDLASLCSPGSRLPRPLAGAPRPPRSGTEQGITDGATQMLAPITETLRLQGEAVYRQAVQAAAARPAGVGGMREAAHAAWSVMVVHGITHVPDGRGRRWRLHEGVEARMRQVAHAAAVRGLVDEYAASGVRLVRVTPAAEGACWGCRPWLEKVLALWGKPRVRVGRHRLPVVPLAQAQAVGLFRGGGCMHSLRPWTPGLVPADPPVPDPGEVIRERRAIERRLHRWRELEMAALTVTGRAWARLRVTSCEQHLARHLAECPDLPVRH